MQFVAYSAPLRYGCERRLRNAGRTTGIVYGAGQEPQAIEPTQRTVARPEERGLPLQHPGHGTERPDQQSGAARRNSTPSSNWCCVNFQRVDASTRIHLKVPLHLKALTNFAVKAEGCTVTPLVHELDVICMPAPLPEFIKVDLSQLTAKSSLGVQNLALPNGVKAVVRGSNKNPALISIKLPEVVVDTAAAAPAAPAKKGKK